MIHWRGWSQDKAGVKIRELKIIFIISYIISVANYGEKCFLVDRLLELIN